MDTLKKNGEVSAVTVGYIPPKSDDPNAWYGHYYKLTVSVSNTNADGKEYKTRVDYKFYDNKMMTFDILNKEILDNFNKKITFEIAEKNNELKIVKINNQLLVKLEEKTS